MTNTNIINNDTSQFNIDKFSKLILDDEQPPQAIKEFFEQKVLSEIKEKVHKISTEIEKINETKIKVASIIKILNIYNIVLKLNFILIEEINRVIISRNELRKHFDNFIKCVQLFKIVLDSVDQLCNLSEKEHPYIQTIEDLIKDITSQYQQFKTISDQVLDQIENGIKKDGQVIVNGIVQLNELKGSTDIKKLSLIGVSSFGFVTSVATIAAGIVLSPITGGLSLISTVGGIIFFLGGTTSSMVSVVSIVLGNKYFSDEKRDIRQTIKVLKNLSLDIKTIVDIFQNKELNDYIQKQFGQLFNKEIKFQKVLCEICEGFCNDPVSIDHPYDEELYFMFCRGCIEGHHHTEKSQNKIAYIPGADGLEFKLDDIKDCERRTKTQIEQLKKKYSELTNRVKYLFIKKDENDIQNNVQNDIQIGVQN